MDNKYVTVFTPTYNRSDLLDKLFQSLISQCDKDFEWVIVDDGSTDDTENKVQSFIDKNLIDIKYLKTTNGGKHRAINKGLDIANGEVFAIVDSDDYLTSDAVKVIKKWFKEISNCDKNFCGIAGCKGYDSEKVVGEFKPKDCIDASNIERKKHGLLGDKFEVYYTEVLKKYRFPEFEGENFMPEIVVWTRMAHDGYILRWHRKILYICNYLEGGLTKNNLTLLSKNPQGYSLRIREQVEYAHLSLKEKMGYYSSYYFLQKRKSTFFQIKKDINANFFILLGSIFLRKCLISIGKDEDNYKTFY